MNKVEYQDYLRSEHWREFKNLAKYELRPHRNGCGICKWNEHQATFHLHHLTYERLGNEDFDDVVFLCCYCHKYVHDLMKTKDCDPVTIVRELKRERAINAQLQYSINGARKIFRNNKQRTYFERPKRPY